MNVDLPTAKEIVDAGLRDVAAGRMRLTSFSDIASVIALAESGDALAADAVASRVMARTIRNRPKLKELLP